MSHLASKLILGTVQFGMNYGINNHSGVPALAEVQRILQLAKKSGITILDTAEGYGQALQNLGAAGVQDFKILSKFLVKESNWSALQQGFFDSLRVLNKTSLQCYSFHSFDEYQNFQFWPELEGLKKQGLISEIGVSLYTQNQFQQVLKDSRIQVVQLPFNLLDNWSRRGQTLIEAKTLGKTIHVRSVFLQGLFFKKLHELPDFASLDIENFKRIQLLANDFSVSVEELCLLYPLSIPEIDGVIIGVEKESQLIANLEAVSKNKFLSPEQLEKIHQLSVVHEQLINPSLWK